MSVVIFLVAAVILGGIVVVATGRGGELARDKVDMPAAVDLQTWSDVARYRPPPALLGYHAATTEQALMLIARSIAERDAEIAWLRGKLAEFQPESVPGGTAIRGDGTVPAERPFRQDEPVREDESLREDESVREDERAPGGSPAAEGSAAPEDEPVAEGSHVPATSDPPVQASFLPHVGQDSSVQPGFLPQAGHAVRAGDE